MADRFIGFWSSKKNKNNDGNAGNGDRAESSNAAQAAPDPYETWSRELEKFSFGEFSFAAQRAHRDCQDYGHVDTGYGAIFVGIYDGSGGPQASRYISDHLVDHLTRIIRDHGTISEDVLKNAFAAIEDGFLDVVKREFRTNKRIATIFSCCLVGMIWNRTIYIANVGDSRAIIARKGEGGTTSCGTTSCGLIAEQLNTDHNVKNRAVRQELRANYPDIPDILALENGVMKVKGVVQVARCIGGACLKKPDYAAANRLPRRHRPNQITRAVLSAEPSVSIRSIQPEDQFLIFASDGLFENMTNQHVVEIVHMFPRTGIARLLVRTALNREAWKYNSTYERYKSKIKDRWTFHDDITVVVIFINHGSLQIETSEPQLSIRSFCDAVASSGFDVLQTLNTSTSSQSIPPTNFDRDSQQTATSEPQNPIRTTVEAVKSSGYDVLQTLNASTSSQSIPPTNFDRDSQQTATSEPQLPIRTTVEAVESSGYDVLQTLNASTSSQPIPPSNYDHDSQQTSTTEPQLPISTSVVAVESSGYDVHQTLNASTSSQSIYPSNNDHDLKQTATSETQLSIHTSASSATDVPQTLNGSTSSQSIHPSNYGHDLHQTEASEQRLSVNTSDAAVASSGSDVRQHLNAIMSSQSIPPPSMIISVLLDDVAATQRQLDAAQQQLFTAQEKIKKQEKENDDRLLELRKLAEEERNQHDHELLELRKLVLEERKRHDRELLEQKEQLEAAQELNMKQKHAYEGQRRNIEEVRKKHEGESQKLWKLIGEERKRYERELLELKERLSTAKEELEQHRHLLQTIKQMSQLLVGRGGESSSSTRPDRPGSPGRDGAAVA